MYKTASKFVQRYSKNKVDAFVHKRKNRGIPIRLRNALKTQKKIKGIILDEIKGGYIISFNGYNAFCPYSEMYPKHISESVLFKRIKQSFEFIVIDIKLQSVIVSRKRVVQMKAWENIQDAFLNGNILIGKVKDIKHYGAFIDLGGIDGFLHISKISDIRISDINLYLKKYQLVRVNILEIDEQKKQISLSLDKRNILEDNNVGNTTT